MATAGLIGGIGPESTVEYYRQIHAAWRERTGDGTAPSVIINSIDLHRLLGLVDAGQLDELTTYLATEIERLARGGADFAALAANTPHIIFKELSKVSPIPLLSIVEATARAAQARGMKRLGLFGTRFTMEGQFYADVFEEAGVALVIPSSADRTYIHDKYVGELLKNVFSDTTRAELLTIAARMKAAAGIDGLILGGTELPLLLTVATATPVPFLDTTKIHVAEIVDRLLK